MSYNRNTHKILSIISFLILLIVAIGLFARFRNIAMQTNDMDTSFGLAYFLVSMIVLFGIINLVQILNLTKEKIFTDEYSKKSQLTDIYNIEEEVKEEKTQETTSEEIDIEPIAEKILPKDNKKLDSNKFCEKVLINIAKEYDIVQGLFYIRETNTDNFTICNKFAYYGEEEPQDFELGKTLSGQVAKDQKAMNLAKIPENYMTILSGLGSSSPKTLLLVPVIHENKTIGLIELASFKDYTKQTEDILNKLGHKIGNELSTKLT